MKNIAIIIPTYNELENIERLIYKIKQKLPDSKIFIIDDSNTQEIGELIKIKNLQVNYYHRENESGRGSAVIYGLIKAVKEQKYQIFIEMDADFSHDPDELLRNIDFFITKKIRFIDCKQVFAWKQNS